MLGRRHCVLTGSGTTALWTAFSCVSPERPKILLPAILCLDPVLGVHYADRIPVFSDVLATNATIDPAYAARRIEEDPAIGAVVAAHLYGSPADIEGLERVCQTNDVLLIEDAAQALGGSHDDGRRFGTAGSAAVLSFGHTKILDVGAGGALLTDDDALADRARSLQLALRPKAEDESLSSSYRDLFYAIWRHGELNPQVLRLFSAFPAVYRNLHVHRATTAMASTIEAALPRLDSEVVERRGRARLYRTGLEGVPGVRFFEEHEGDVPWRFSFRVPATRREEVLVCVRDAGFDASRWYPNVSAWTAHGERAGEYPVADLIEAEVVNLWVTEDYSDARIGAVVDAVAAALS